jgi:hypothetical protein
MGRKRRPSDEQLIHKLREAKDDEGRARAHDHLPATIFVSVAGIRQRQA